MRGDGAGFGYNLSALDFFTVYAAKKDTRVVARLSKVKALAEHFYTGNHAGFGVFDTYDFNGVLNLNLSALYSAGSNGAAAGDGEHVFNRHKERLVYVARGSGYLGVYGVHKVVNGLDCGVIGVARHSRLESFNRTAADYLGVFEAVALQKLGNFHFNKVEKFFVVDKVGLVKEHYNLGHANLTGKQDVLAGLGHGTVGSRNNEYSAVHLSGTGNHVLYVVGVARAVNVSVVTGFGLILNVSGVNRDAARLFLGSGVDFVVFFLFRQAFGCKSHGDGCGKGGLAVVNVADGADVNVRLASVELSFCHFEFSSENFCFLILVFLFFYIITQTLKYFNRFTCIFANSFVFTCHCERTQ